MLGVERNATQAQIKKAYHTLCLTWHPDKNASGTEDAQAKAAHKFSRIHAAYEKLKSAGAGVGGASSGFSYSQPRPRSYNTAASWSGFGQQSQQGESDGDYDYDEEEDQYTSYARNTRGW